MESGLAYICMKQHMQVNMAEKRGWSRMNEKRFRLLEIIGVPVCFGLAVLLHFVYQWSGGVFWIGLIAPVNESVWEHGKLLITPYLLWAVLEWFLVRPPVKRFVAVKTAAMYAMVAAMIVFYYAYTAVVGHHVAVVDVISTLVWIALGFYLSFRLMQNETGENWFTVALFGLILLWSAFFSFTLNPPEWELFRDVSTGKFGIPAAVPGSGIPV